MPVVNAYLFQHVGIPVNDLVRSREFYTNVLGLHMTQESSEWNADAPVRLHCGNEPLPGQQVVLFKRPKPLRRDANAEDDHSHHAFVVTPEEFEVALEKFKEMGFLHRGPIQWPSSKHRTLYFFDPDGNYLQLSDGEEE